MRRRWEPSFWIPSGWGRKWVYAGFCGCPMLHCAVYGEHPRRLLSFRVISVPSLTPLL